MTTKLWERYAAQTSLEDWAGMSKAEVAKTLAGAGASKEEISDGIDEFMSEIPELHTCKDCGAAFYTYNGDTAQSGSAWGFPDLCWSCGFDRGTEDE